MICKLVRVLIILYCCVQDLFTVQMANVLTLHLNAIVKTIVAIGLMKLIVQAIVTTTWPAVGML